MDSMLYFFHQRCSSDRREHAVVDGSRRWRKMRERLTFSLLFVFAMGTAVPAQDSSMQDVYSFGGDVGVASKYIWRGQRLTDDWSLQTSGTVGIGPFYINVWGNMDLAAVNEGDALFIPENPATPPGDHSGLQGKFSEVDYVFGFSHSFADVTLDAGTIFYTFPERSASLPTTTEIFGGVTFDSVPLAPSATLYVDVDETGDAGDTGIYFELAAAHSIPLRHDRFTGIDLSAWISFVNDGFANLYYGETGSGPHDVNFTVAAPVTLDENWSLNAFISYSALLSEFRDFQLRDPREVFLGTAGSPATFADTVWGGITLSVAF